MTMWKDTKLTARDMASLGIWTFTTMNLRRLVKLWNKSLSDSPEGASVELDTDSVNWNRIESIRCQ